MIISPRLINEGDVSTSTEYITTRSFEPQCVLYIEHTHCEDTHVRLTDCIQYTIQIPKFCTALSIYSAPLALCPLGFFILFVGSDMYVEPAGAKGGAREVTGHGVFVEVRRGVVLRFMRKVEAR